MVEPPTEAFSRNSGNLILYDLFYILKLTWILKQTTEVKKFLVHSKKLEADMAIVRNVNSKLVERVATTERQCWENPQYSSRDTLEVVEIPTSVRDNVLEQKVCEVFWEIGVDICDRDIQVCHCLNDKD